MCRMSRIAGRVILVLLLVGSAACGNKKPRPVDTNFANFAALAEGISKADTILLYEGLPHQGNEQKVFKDELRKPHILLHEYPFYSELLELNSVDRAELSKLMVESSHFEPWRGEKKCGGYHPDYAIEWRTNGDVYHGLVCLGCSEVKFFGPRSELHCDMTSETKHKLMTLFKPYRKNRPEPQVD